MNINITELINYWKEWFVFMRWKKEEEEYLLKSWKIKSLTEIMEFLGKTRDGVIRKAGRMGLDTRKAPDTLIKKKWTINEDQYMINNYNLLSLETLMMDLNRSRYSILKRAQCLNLTLKLRHWTEIEINYLEENWGIKNINIISKKLDRSIDAVYLKACQLSLREEILANGYFLTPKYISEILNINVRSIYNCMFNGLLQFRKYKVKSKTKYQISIEYFLDFLKNNKTIWDSKIADMQTIKSYYSSYNITSKNAFTVNISLPNWLQSKIQEDLVKKSRTRHNLQWTINEDKLLHNLTKASCSFEEIAIRLNRTPSSIKSRYYAIRNNKYNSEFLNIRIFTNDFSNTSF